MPVLSLRDGDGWSNKDGASETMTGIVVGAVIAIALFAIYTGWRAALRRRGQRRTAWDSVVPSIWEVQITRVGSVKRKWVGDVPEGWADWTVS